VHVQRQIQDGIGVFFVVECQAVNGNEGIVSFENFDLRGVHWKQEFTAVDCVPMVYVRRQLIGITTNGIQCRQNGPTETVRTVRLDVYDSPFLHNRL